MIGALSEAVSLPITTAVTCPTVRIHPAIIAHAAATAAVQHVGRFVLPAAHRGGSPSISTRCPSTVMGSRPAYSRYDSPMAADPMVDLRRRFTVEEYERMGEVGVFDPDERVELLDGEIVAMSPIGPRHASVVDIVAERLYARLIGRVAIRIQNPVRLPPHSEPQPDVIVARRRRDFYRSAHPTAEDTLLVIEVADSSLRMDRAVKLPIYAREGVIEVWIVDLGADVVHLHARPVDGVYRDVRTVSGAQPIVPVAIPDLTLTPADLLGG